jgi:hypothetical protein
MMGKAKNAEFDAEFESVEKVAKKFTGRKVEVGELLHTVVEGKKLHNSYCTVQYTSMLINVQQELFGFEISIKFCVF